MSRTLSGKVEDQKKQTMQIYFHCIFFLYRRVPSDIDIKKRSAFLSNIHSLSLHGKDTGQVC